MPASLFLFALAFCSATAALLATETGGLCRHAGCQFGSRGKARQGHHLLRPIRRELGDDDGRSVLDHGQVRLGLHKRNPAAWCVLRLWNLVKSKLGMNHDFRGKQPPHLSMTAKLTHTLLTYP
jgi:hypothetical protein